MRNYRTLLIVSLCLALSTVNLHAGGPAFTRLFGAADSAEVSYLNPAGMTRLDGPVYSGQMILGASLSEFEVDPSVTTTSGGDPDDPAPVIVPSFYHVRPIFGDKWRLGLALNVPGGFGANNGSSWAGRYYSDDFSLIFVAATATVARRVSPWLSLGGGLSVQYSSSDSTTRVPNPMTPGDARLEVETDGVAAGWIGSAMFEFSERTRLAVTVHSETDPEENPEVKLKDSTLPDFIVDEINKAGEDIDSTLRTPRHVDIGLYHEWGNGWSATLDAVWVEFSRFGLTELQIEDEDLSIPDNNFNNFWILTSGVQFPVSERTQGRFGGVYIEEPVADEDRTFSFALDHAWGFGAGILRTRESGRKYDLNATVLRLGSAPVDTGPESALSPRGRVAGTNDSPWVVVLDFTYHWNRR